MNQFLPVHIIEPKKNPATRLQLLHLTDLPNVSFYDEEVQTILESIKNGKLL